MNNTECKSNESSAIRLQNEILFNKSCTLQEDINSEDLTVLQLERRKQKRSNDLNDAKEIQDKLDLEKKNHILEQELKEIKLELEKCFSKILEEVRLNNSFNLVIDKQKQELALLRDENKSLLNIVDELHLTIEEKENIVIEYQKEIERLDNENHELTQENYEAKYELIRFTKDNEDLISKLKQVHENELNGNQDNLILASSFQTLEQENEMLKIKLNEMNEFNAKELQELQEKLCVSEVVRRGLHNKVMDLKGNVRVFCRVRPILREIDNVSENSINIFSFPGRNKNVYKEIELLKPEYYHTSYKESDQPTLSYTFDYVFPPESSQSDIFNEVSCLVQSAVYGDTVCIFAYGQTGSGKTYTMQNGCEDLTNTDKLAPDAGLIARALYHMFFWCEEELGWNYNISLEMFEIYNEKIIDLLVEDQVASNLKVRQCTKKRLNNSKDAMIAIQLAVSKRSTRETSRNNKSSRSHCIMRFHLDGIFNNDNNIRRSGIVSLIDLAGSESLNSSNKEEQNETKSINTGLAVLSRCINSLLSKENHIPFRESKLTACLEDSFRDASKTLMICNLSPLVHNYSESKNTIEFAKRISTCKSLSKRKSK